MKKKAGPLVLMRSSPALGRGIWNSSSVSGRPGSQKTGAAHVAGPARHVVPRGGCGVGPRRCRGGEGAAEERTADPAEEGAGGGSGHGHGLGSTNSAAAVKQLLTTPSSLLLQVCSRPRFSLTFDWRLFVTTSNLFVFIYIYKLRVRARVVNTRKIALKLTVVVFFHSNPISNSIQEVV